MIDYQERFTKIGQFILNGILPKRNRVGLRLGLEMIQKVLL